MPNIIVEQYSHGTISVLDEGGNQVSSLDPGRIGTITGETGEGWEFVEYYVDRIVAPSQMFTMGEDDVIVSGLIVQSETVEIDLDQVADAAGNTQFFWTREDGAHVTDLPREDFEEGETSDFPDVSDTKPYSNLLMNSLGILLRSADKIMAGFSREAVAFFDGLGNATENIAAMFGRSRARVGNAKGMHTDIEDGSISMLNGTDRLMRIGGELTGETKVYHLYGASEMDGPNAHIDETVVEGEEVYPVPLAQGMVYVEAPQDEPKPYLWIKSDKLADVDRWYTAEEAIEEDAEAFAEFFVYSLETASNGIITRYIYTFSHTDGNDGTTEWAIRSTYPERLPMTAIGEGCVAASPNQVVLGRYNVIDSAGAYALIVGNGTDDAHRSNALTIDWNGNIG